MSRLFPKNYRKERGSHGGMEGKGRDGTHYSKPDNLLRLGLQPSLGHLGGQFSL